MSRPMSRSHQPGVGSMAPGRSVISTPALTRVTMRRKYLGSLPAGWKSGPNLANHRADRMADDDRQGSLYVQWKPGWGDGHRGRNQRSDVQRKADPTEQYRPVDRHLAYRHLA